MRKHRDMKVVTTERRRNYLASEPNYILQSFSQKFTSNRNDKNSNTNELACLFKFVNI